MYIFICTYVNKYTYTHTRTHTHTHIYVYMCVRLYVCVIYMAKDGGGGIVRV